MKRNAIDKGIHDVHQPILNSFALSKHCLMMSSDFSMHRRLGWVYRIRCTITYSRVAQFLIETRILSANSV